jgi:hypothetical protein
VASASCIEAISKLASIQSYREAAGALPVNRVEIDHSAGLLKAGIKSRFEKPAQMLFFEIAYRRS